MPGMGCSQPVGAFVPTFGVYAARCGRGYGGRIRPPQHVAEAMKVVLLSQLVNVEHQGPQGPQGKKK